MPLAFLGVIATSIGHAARLAKRQRDEQELLRQADEAVRMGAWDRAGSLLSPLLLRPTDRQQVRLQGLIYLGGVYNRNGRFSDLIRLYEYILEHAATPPQIALSIRCMRAYAMLRDDRLSDAYEAISQLRRDFEGGSGMLSVIEIYRLVKTGHHGEALELFDQTRGKIIEQLSHRSADAWALASFMFSKESLDFIQTFEPRIRSRDDVPVPNEPVMTALGKELLPITTIRPADAAYSKTVSPEIQLMTERVVSGEMTPQQAMDAYAKAVTAAVGANRIEDAK